MPGVKSLLQAAADEMNQIKSNELKSDNKDNTNSNIKYKKTVNLGGRPTNDTKGIKSRKQYSITLREDTYNLVNQKAREEDLSFGKFMEKAVLEYINRHYPTETETE